MKAPPRRPLPIVGDIESKPFWDGCARGELLLQRCLNCGALRHPPSPICAKCLSPRNEWLPASGDATAYSFVVVHRDVVDVPPERVKIGMPLRVWFDRVSDEVTLPKFRPA